MDDQFLKSLQSTQELDQAKAGMKLLASLLRAHNQALRAEGFGMLEALQMTIAYQSTLLTMNQSNQNGGQK